MAEKKDMMNETGVEEPKNQDQQQETKPAEGEKMGFFKKNGPAIMNGLAKVGKWTYNAFAVIGMAVVVCEGVHYVADKRSKSLLDEIDGDSAASTTSIMDAVNNIEI